MGRKAITIDQLESEINSILNDYSMEVSEKVEKVVVDYAKISKRKLNESSPKRTGKYAKGWAYKKEGAKRDNVKTITYNAAKPGLAHLLEFGHALRGGGRVSGRTHINPVEEEVITGVMNTLEQVLGS